MATPPVREPHYSKISEWTSECGANGMETAVHQHLAKRLNHASGSRIVDPSRARLAADVGLKKADDVDPYLRALEALGVLVIHAKKGLRTKYELPLWPPEGYDGPANTHAADKWQKEDPKGYAAWRAARRALVDAAEAPYAAKRRARVAKSTQRKKPSKAPDVPVVTGRYEDPDVPVATGTHLPVVTGTHRPVTTGTNQDDTNDQTNMGDGRRPTTGSRADGGSGCAASGNTEPLPHTTPASSIRSVLETIPAPLVQLLEKDWPRGLPASVTAMVEKALTAEQRTVDQIGERIARRWLAFGYEDALLSIDGPGLRTGLGVLEEMLSPSKCWGNNLDCEDGVDVRTRETCPRCEEHREDRRAASDRDTPSEHPAVDCAGNTATYTAPAYVVPTQQRAVGVNEGLARDARAAILESRSKARR